jgi:hypothetical protein
MAFLDNVDIFIYSFSVANPLPQNGSAASESFNARSICRYYHRRLPCPYCNADLARLYNSLVVQQLSSISISGT